MGDLKVHVSCSRTRPTESDCDVTKSQPTKITFTPPTSKDNNCFAQENIYLSFESDYRVEFFVTAQFKKPKVLSRLKHEESDYFSSDLDEPVFYTSSPRADVNSANNFVLSNKQNAASPPQKRLTSAIVAQRVKSA